MILAGSCCVPALALTRAMGRLPAEGTKTRMALASLFETWHARRLNLFDECLKLLSQVAVS